MFAARGFNDTLAGEHCLLSDQDPAAVLSSIAACLLPSGVFRAAILDDDVLRGEAPAGIPISVHGIVGSRRASGQAWTWASDREFVPITLFTLEEPGKSVDWCGIDRAGG